MSVKSGQAITVLFCTQDPTTGAATDADSTPTGTLYVNGTANGATVTETNISTGLYKAAFTLPSLTAGDVASLSIAATVGGVAGEGVVWQEVADTERVSDLNDVSSADVNAACDTALTDYDAPTKAELDSGLAGLNDLDAAGVRTAVGLASANLDTQLSALPTTAEVNAEVDTALSDINLDHLASVATAGSDMTVEVADNTILSRILANGDTSAFDPSTDGLQFIRDAITDASPQNHSATANNETTGTLDAGTYANTATSDGSYYQVSPAGALVDGFGLNVDLTFGIGVGRVPDQVEITAYFDSGAQRTVQVWAYDYNTASYVQLSNSINDFGNAGSNQTFQYPMTNNMHQVSDGEVKIRFTSTSITIADNFYCDMVSVSSVAQEAGGLTADSIQAAVWARSHTGHDEETLGYNVARMHLLQGDIVSATSASQFIIDAGVAVDDAYNGAIIVLEDKTDDHYEIRRVADYVGSTREVFVDRAFGFTPVASDDYYIMNAAYSDVNTTHISGTVQTANDNGADINEILLDTGTDGVVLANDAITSAKYDESTAYPVKSADTGSTQIARVGADSDTLETLSDQIDGASTLDASGVRTAVGLAAANLDTQLSALPDAAAINAEVDTALADYDAPTKAELDSGLEGLNDLDAAGIRTAVGLASADLDTQLSVIQADLDDPSQYKADVSALATSVDLATVDGNVDSIKTVTDKVDDTLEDDGGTYRFTENALEEGPSGGASVAGDVWAYATRTLTQTAASTESTTAAKITRTRGNTWTITITGLSLAGYTTIDFVIKDDVSDADTSAVLWVRKNASGLSDGLLKLNKAAIASPVVATDASMVVGDDDDSVTITVKPVVTKDIAPKKRRYDLQTIISSVIDTPSKGTFTVDGDITRATS